MLSEVRLVLLTVWHPIPGTVPDDEYDSYVSHVASMLVGGADRHRLTDHLFQLEIGSMGLSGDRVRCARAADRLLSLLAAGKEARHTATEGEP